MQPLFTLSKASNTVMKNYVYVIGKKYAVLTRPYITRVCKTFTPGYFRPTLNCVL
jgi:hypothetical protein